MKRPGFLKQWTVGKILPLSNKFGFRVTLYFELGKDVQQHGGYLSREDAGRARILLEAELDKQIYIVDTTCRVEEFMVFWLEEIKRPWLTSDSYNSYKNCVYHYIIPQLGKLKMIKLNRLYVMALYRYTVERSPTVAQILGSVIQVSLRYAQNEHYIYKDPLVGIRLPKKIKDDTQAFPEEILSPEKVCVLLDAGRNTSLYLPMLFAALIGLRRSKNIGLKYSDIDIFTGTLHVQRQLGSDPHRDKNQMSHGTKTTQEIRLKTPSSTRILKIPQIVLQAILDEQIKNERRKE